MKNVLRLSLITILTVVGFLSYAPVAEANGLTILVNTAADNVTGGDGLCTLREAITRANAEGAADTFNSGCSFGNVGPDVIGFAGNYTITLDPVLGQLPQITSTVTIAGNGSANTIIQANASPNTATYRVFAVGAAGNLTLLDAYIWMPSLPADNDAFGAPTLKNHTYDTAHTGNVHRSSENEHKMTLTLFPAFWVEYDYFVNLEIEATAPINTIFSYFGARANYTLRI